MKTQVKPSNIPSRILYSMIRVGDIDRSIGFYSEALGMRVLRRETFTEERFTLVFMGYEDSNASVELTYNWDQDNYEHGTGYGHIALEVNDIYDACERLSNMGVKITRDAGPMTNGSDETGEREIIAFIKDPDGYAIELIGKQ